MNATAAAAPSSENDSSMWHVVGVPELAGRTYVSMRSVMDAMGSVSPFPLAGTFDIRSGAFPASDAQLDTFDAPKLVDLLAVGPVVLDVALPREGDFTYDVGEEQFSQASADRINAHDKHLRSFGIVMAPPVRQLGGVVNSTGRANLSLSHETHSKMPRTIDAMNEVVATVARENRADVPVEERRSLTMNDRGQLVTQWGEVDVEENAWPQTVSLFSDALPRMAEGMALLNPNTRARVFNEQVLKSTKGERPIVLRARVTARTAGVRCTRQSARHTPRSTLTAWPSP